MSGQTESGLDQFARAENEEALDLLGLGDGLGALRGPGRDPITNVFQKCRFPGFRRREDQRPLAKTDRAQKIEQA